MATVFEKYQSYINQAADQGLSAKEVQDEGIRLLKTEVLPVLVSQKANSDTINAVTSRWFAKQQSALEAAGYRAMQGETSEDLLDRRDMVSRSRQGGLSLAIGGAKQGLAAPFKRFAAGSNTLAASVATLLNDTINEDENGVARQDTALAQFARDQEGFANDRRQNAGGDGLAASMMESLPGLVIGGGVGGAAAKGALALGASTKAAVLTGMGAGAAAEFPQNYGEARRNTVQKLSQISDEDLAANLPDYQKLYEQALSGGADDVTARQVARNGVIDIVAQGTASKSAAVMGVISTIAPSAGGMAASRVAGGSMDTAIGRAVEGGLSRLGLKAPTLNPAAARRAADELAGNRVSRYSGMGSANLAVREGVEESAQEAAMNTFVEDARSTASGTAFDPNAIKENLGSSFLAGAIMGKGANMVTHGTEATQFRNQVAAMQQQRDQLNNAMTQQEARLSDLQARGMDAQILQEEVAVRDQLASELGQIDQRMQELGIAATQEQTTPTPDQANKIELTPEDRQRLDEIRASLSDEQSTQDQPILPPDNAAAPILEESPQEQPQLQAPPKTGLSGVSERAQNRKVEDVPVLPKPKIQPLADQDFIDQYKQAMLDDDESRLLSLSSNQAISAGAQKTGDLIRAARAAVLSEQTAQPPVSQSSPTVTQQAKPSKLPQNALPNDVGDPKTGEAFFNEIEGHLAAKRMGFADNSYDVVMLEPHQYVVRPKNKTSQPNKKVELAENSQSATIAPDGIQYPDRHISPSPIAEPVAPELQTRPVPDALGESLRAEGFEQVPIKSESLVKYTKVDDVGQHDRLYKKDGSLESDRTTTQYEGGVNEHGEPFTLKIIRDNQNGKVFQIQMIAPDGFVTRLPSGMPIPDAKIIQGLESVADVLPNPTPVRPTKIEKKFTLDDEPMATPEPQPQMQPDDIGRPSDGKPFANKNAATLVLKKDGLEEDHDIVQLGQSAFVIRPKSPQSSPDQSPQPQPVEADPIVKPPIVGEPIDQEWMAFSPKSQTLKIPRAQMPQIKAEHRGAMVNFLNARGITHEQLDVPAQDLKPSQAEFSPAKVQAAKEYQGGDRSILVSSDNHVLDGHHQWLSKYDANEPVKIIRLNAPIQELLATVKDFPSAQPDDAQQTATKSDVKPPREDWRDSIATARQYANKLISEGVLQRPDVVNLWGAPKLTELVAAIDAALESQSAPSQTTREKLLDIAKRLRAPIITGGNTFNASVGGLVVPTEDQQVESAISADHVLSHELGHFIMMKVGQFSYAKFTKARMAEVIPNFADLVAASKAFRPAVWSHASQKIREHARKNDEIIADAIASVLMGSQPIDLLQDLMDRTGLIAADLGLPKSTTEVKTNEPTELGQPSTRPLEGIPTDSVQSTEGERPTGSQATASSRDDLSGDGRTGESGLQRTRSVGDGSPDVSVSTGGSRTGSVRSDRPSGRETEADARQPSGSDLAVIPAPEQADDFALTEQDNIGSGGAKTKFKGNVEAIRILKTLMAEGRKATREEQRKLAKFVGWGGLQQAFRRDDGSVANGWAKEVDELENLLTPDEYKAAVDSSIAAHYTSPEIVKGIWDAVKQLGFTGGRVLEPSMGSGNFFGMMPKDLRKSAQLHGVELDNITGHLAQQLYPEAKIKVMGFQDYAIPDGHFDLAIGNPPFGAIKITDASRPRISGLSLHNYFFAKSVDALAENGVLAMVVTNRLLDASNANDKARQYMAERTEFLGAIRLPNNAFAKNAGTEVTTDIIFLRKLTESERMEGAKGHAWVNVRPYTDKNGKQVPLNEYFHKNPSMMLGEFGAYGSMYTPDDPALVAREGQNTPELMAQAIAKLPKAIMADRGQQKAEAQHEQNIADIPNVKVGSMFVQDGQVYVRQPDQLGERQAEPVEMPSAKALDRVTGMTEIRDALNQLRLSQLSDDTSPESIEADRAALNKAYDAFVKRNGYLNSDANKRLFRDDPSWPQLSSLEDGFDKGISAAVSKNTGEQVREPSAKKAAIFQKRTQFPYTRIESVSNAKDGMVESLNRLGRLDIGLITQLYGKDEQAVIKELGDLIYQDPVYGWVTADEYLSGNVKKKLAQAKDAVASGEDLQRNVEALEKVQPADIEAVDIEVRAGSHWIPSKHVVQFIKDTLAVNSATAHYNNYAASWDITTSTVPESAQTSFGTVRANAVTVLIAALNGKQITIYDQLPENKTEVNAEATAAANEKVEQVKRAWADWIWKDDVRRIELARIYNDTFNTTVQQRFDGAHLSLLGKVDNAVIELRPHQADAIWRITQTPTALLDHVVGAGKTFTMIGAIMELRRMGKSSKPMLVVPNHLVGQWAADFQKLYPSANILAANKKDFEKNNRKRLFARIATGDWDAVIVAHSSFGKVPLSPEEEAEFMKAEIKDMMDAEARIRSESGKDSRNAKDIAKRRMTLEEKLKKLIAEGRKDSDNLYWHELGVDSVFVDEAHEFKNLAFSSGMQRVAGLGNQKGSQKAFDLFMKIKSIKNRIAGSKIVFATGTPISNTMAEMYTMQRYLDLDAMQEQGLGHFDAWAKMFGQVVSDWELSPAGKYKMNSRFAKFVNMPELMQRYLSFADVINRDDINRQLAARGQTLGTPKIKGDKPQNIVVERSDDQAGYIGEPIVDKDGNETYPQGTLVHRAENLPKKAEKGADNMLKIMSDARKAALDMRLIDPSLPDYEGSKTNEAVRRSVEIYKKWDADKGTQLIFCDLSTPKGAAAGEKARIEELIRLADQGDEEASEQLDKLSPDELDALNSDFSVYDDIKAKLIKSGIPEKEIAFIHDAKTELQKEELFGKVKSGRIRVLLGSTAKMGAGMNVQNRLVALHHLDAPWRPSDLEQREGRIIRQGNEFYKRDPEGFEIEILRYATKQTLDSRMWQTLESKARFIEQVRKGDVTSRVIEDVGGEAANAAEMKAASSGNPLILEEMSLRRELQNLESEKSRHNREQHRIKDTIRSLVRDQSSHDRNIAELTQDMSVRVPEKFEITIGKKTFKQGQEGARDQAGELLKEAAIKSAQLKQDFKVGSYGDFDLFVQHYSFSRDSVQFIATSPVTGGKYSVYFTIGSDSPAGLITKIGNRLRSIPDMLKTAEDQKARDLAEIPKLESQLKDWSKADELEAKREQHKSIIDQLKPKSKEAATTTSTQPEVIDAKLGLDSPKFSRKLPDITTFEDPVVQAWLMLSQNDEAFQLPTSDKKDFSQILGDLEGGAFTAQKNDFLAEVRRVDQGWVIELPHGEAYVMQKGREVWIDLSDSTQGGGVGSRLYNAVANYAHNNNLVFIGDPDGLSDVAMSRLLENMLSSALKFGTTRHLQPHELQLEGNQDVPALDWRVGDDQHNIRQMIDASYTATIRQFPAIESITYDPDSDQFIHRNGEVWDVERFNREARSARSSDSGSMVEHSRGDSLRRPITAGRRTLERAVLTHAILRATGSERSRLLARYGKLSTNAGGRLAGILYSQRATSSAPLSVNAVRQTLNQRFGADTIAKLEADGKLNIIQSESEIPADALRSVMAWHGSPHNFERFSLEHLGRGEGAQMFGWGLYFSGAMAVAEHYRESLSTRDLINHFSNEIPEDADFQDALDAAQGMPKPYADVINELSNDDWLGFDDPMSAITAAFKNLKDYEHSSELRLAVDSLEYGQLYRVEMTPNDQDFLVWDTLISKQDGIYDKIQDLKKRLSDAGILLDVESRLGHDFDQWMGAELYSVAKLAATKNLIPIHGRTDKSASLYLQSLGLAGIKYLDGVSRQKTSGTFNYVLFDDAAVRIVDTYYSQNPKGVEGYYHRGTTVLVADNLSPDTIVPTLLHEMGGHGGFQTILKPQVYDDLMSQFDRMVAAKNPIALKAKSRAESAESDLARQRDEYLPYLITEAARSQDQRGGAVQAVMRLVKRIVAAVRAYLYDRHGVQLKITPDDIVALAERMVKRRTDTTAQPSIQEAFSRSNADTPQAEIDQVRREHEGKPTWMKAPNGKPTNLTERQWLQVRTPQFKQWFGDWEADPKNASKVRDENGEPLVTYHGTTGDFNEFNSGEGVAVWVSDSVNVADRYAHARSYDATDKYQSIIPLYVSAKSVFDTKDMPDFIGTAELFFTKMIDQAVSKSLMFESDRKSVLDISKKLDELAVSQGVYLEDHKIHHLWFAPNILFGKSGKDLVYQAISIIGFDAIQYLEAESVTIGVLSANQIKSAIGNSGRFNPSNADIRFSKSEAHEAALYAAAQSKRVKEWIGDKLNTMLHLALHDQQFRVTFDRLQSKINQTASDAFASIQAAPEILGRMETWADTLYMMKGLLPKAHQARQADMNTAAKALFEGTLIDKKVYSDGQLRDLYELTPEQIQIYRNARKAIDITLNKAARASIMRVMLDAGAEFDSIKKMLDLDISLYKTRDAARQLIDDLVDSKPIGSKERSQAEKSRTQAISRINDILEKRKKLHEEGYAPLMRFGNYWLTIKDGKDETALHQRFETELERDKAVRQLKRDNAIPQDHQLSIGKDNPEKYRLFREVSPEAMLLFAKEAGIPIDDAHQTYLKLATANHSALRRMIHRKGIAGYSEDLQRVLAAFVMSTARYSAHLVFNEPVMESVRQINDADKQKAAQDMVAYAQDPREEAQLFKSLLFIWNMGASIMFGLVNMTQPIMQTMPWLTREVGSAALPEILRGMKQALHSFRTGKIPEEFKTEYEHAQREGHLDPANVWMLQGIERGKSGLSSNYWTALTHSMGLIAQATETVNRRATLFAALRASKRMSAEQLQKYGGAYSFAIQAIQETQGIYNKGNRPRLSRGTVGSLLMVYKQFSIAYVEQMIRAARNPKWKGEDDKWRRSLMLMLALLWSLAGTAGLPFAQNAADAASAFMAWSGSPVQIKKEAQDLLGEDVADLIINGAFNINAVLDVQGRTSMGNLLPGTALLNPTASEFERENGVASMFGASGGLLKKGYDSAIAASRGAYGTAAIGALPRSMSSVAKAIDMAATGEYRNAKGNLVTYATGFEAFIKALDANPARIADEQRKMMQAYDAKQLHTVVQKRMNDDMLEAILDRDQKAKQEVRRRVKAWNDANPDYPVRINTSNLRRKARENGDDWRERINMPKGMDWAVEEGQ